MKTNFQMLREMQFKPKEFGWLSASEVDELVRGLAIKERSDIELQNLRDFVVMYYSHLEDSTQVPGERMEYADIMSGICGVIDQEKFNRRMEV